MVDGLSTPEIGSRLFVSRGTVKTHLSHVYAKLGVANRTELATLATPRLAKADDPEKGARSDRTDLLRGGWSDEARGVGRDALHGGPPC